MLLVHKKGLSSGLLYSRVLLAHGSRYFSAVGVYDVGRSFLSRSIADDNQISSQLRSLLEEKGERAGCRPGEPITSGAAV